MNATARQLKTIFLIALAYVMLGASPALAQKSDGGAQLGQILGSVAGKLFAGGQKKTQQPAQVQQQTQPAQAQMPQSQSYAQQAPVIQPQATGGYQQQDMGQYQQQGYQQGYQQNYQQGYQSSYPQQYAQQGAASYQQQYDTTAQQPQAASVVRFDPTTGKPLTGLPKFDPVTGKPMMPKFDPFTGLPISEEQAGTLFPDFAKRPEMTSSSDEDEEKGKDEDTKEEKDEKKSDEKTSEETEDKAKPDDADKKGDANKKDNTDKAETQDEEQSKKDDNGDVKDAKKKEEPAKEETAKEEAVKAEPAEKTEKDEAAPQEKREDRKRRDARERPPLDRDYGYDDRRPAPRDRYYDDRRDPLPPRDDRYYDDRRDSYPPRDDRYYDDRREPLPPRDDQYYDDPRGSFPPQDDRYYDEGRYPEDDPYYRDAPERQRPGDDRNWSASDRPDYEAALKSQRAQTLQAATLPSVQDLGKVHKGKVQLIGNQIQLLQHDVKSFHKQNRALARQKAFERKKWNQLLIRIENELTALQNDSREFLSRLPYESSNSLSQNQIRIPRTFLSAPALEIQDGTSEIARIELRKELIDHELDKIMTMNVIFEDQLQNSNLEAEHLIQIKNELNALKAREGKIKKLLNQIPDKAKQILLQTANQT